MKRYTKQFLFIVILSITTIILPGAAFSEVYIQWNAVDGATYYKVYKGATEADIAQDHTRLNMDEPTACAVNYDQLEATTYFQVKAFDSGDEVIDTSEPIEVQVGIDTYEDEDEEEGDDESDDDNNSTVKGGDGGGCFLMEILRARAKITSH